MKLIRFLSTAVSRHRKFLLITALIATVLFYVEFLSYQLNTWSWPAYTLVPRQRHQSLRARGFDVRNTDVLRLLLIADPQLIGENDPKWWQRLVAAWDSDRYLRVNYDLAKKHIDPNMVVFLGDLTDEGVTTGFEAQYRRYYKRFTSVFQIPKKGDPTPIEYLYLPGDNDAGGDGSPLDPVKLKWFNFTFGEYHKPFRIKKHGWDLEILKIWTRDLNQTHANRTLPALGTPSTTIPTIEILISHLPLLNYTNTTVEEIVERLNPALVISAHWHDSSIRSYDKILKSTMTYTHNYLSRMSGGSGKAVLSEGYATSERMLHEISIPTCSYRMGVTEMGFGVLELHKNGTMEYSVLWLPSRFTNLCVYGVVVIFLLIWPARWVVVRLWQRHRSHRHRLVNVKGVWKMWGSSNGQIQTLIGDSMQFSERVITNEKNSRTGDSVN